VRDRLDHDQLTSLAELRERGRKLGADVAAANQRDPVGGFELLPDRVRVAHRAQVMDVRPIPAGHIETHRRGSRGQK